MNIYLVTRTDKYGADYDEYDAFVVKASDIDEVRKFAEEVKNGRTIWETNIVPPYKIEKIGEYTGGEMEFGIILASFNAG